MIDPLDETKREAERLVQQAKLFKSPLAFFAQQIALVEDVRSRYGNSVADCCPTCSKPLGYLSAGPNSIIAACCGQEFVFVGEPL